MKTQKTDKGTLSRVLRYIARYRPLMILSLVLTVCNVALSLYVPIRVGDAIDHIIGQGNVHFSAVGTILLWLGILIVCGAWIQWIIGTLNNRIAFAVVRDIRNDAFAHIQTLPLSYLDTHRRGETLNRMITDAEQFADGLLLGFTQLFSGVLTIIGTLAFMLTIHYKIAFVVVVLTPLSLFIAKFIAKRTYHLFLDQSQARAAQTALIDEMIANQKIVSAFRYESRACERFEQTNEMLAKASLRATFYSSVTNPATRFVNNVVYAAVALTGALACLATAGAAIPFTVGKLCALLSYANQYTKPFNEISGVLTEFQNALACAGRIFELLREPSEMPDLPDAPLLHNVQGAVDLCDVSFSYSPDTPLIENLNLHVHPGQRIAIVGPTGCGKTTLINLLMRFYDVDKGKITVDQSDICRVTRHSLRGSYGMVLQDTWIRAGTVRDNIAMGKPDATEEQIIAAAKETHADSFIRRLSHGYDTVIGEDGGSLSQGQKQLLCVTRLMLLYPPMLILDEATSSIDTRTEIRIQHAFSKLMEGKTTFIVAHRLSTVRDADCILVMRDGNIVEQGTHEQLLQCGGFYAVLYNSQFTA